MNRFRLSTFLVDDFDTSIVRIEKSKMREIGIRDGDTVKITGMESTGAVCSPIDDGFEMPNDSEITYINDNPVILPPIRTSNFVGRNINRLGVGLIPVTVTKMHDGTSPASKVCLMSLNSNLDNTSFDKSKMHGLIATKHDRFTFRDPEPKNNFGYMVTCVEPSDYSQITKDTAIEFVTVSPEALHTSLAGAKLEKLQEVIPIAYQKTLNNIDVMMPSIEIFHTGFRFYVYIKSDFDSDQKVLNGSVSVVVTLDDDIGNPYVLTSHGGGGSHSPQGFEYKHEFHGKPFHSDAKHLTITLHEVLIQERFPREDSSAHRQKPLMGTKEEYAKIDRFPSFFIIQGPWKAVFPVQKRK